MVKLTKRTVENVEPTPGGDVFVWDAALPGFGLRVYPSGKRKYVLQYRTAGNRQRREVIGQHGVLTAESARAIARDKLMDVRRGRDPAAEKKAVRDAPTMQDLSRDYLDRHANPKKRRASADNDKSMLDRWVLPKLGPVKVAAVGRPDIERLHNCLRATPYAANRLLALLSKMFNLAVAWGWRTDNPAQGIPRYHEDRRERWLSAEELARLWSVLDGHPNQRAANAIKLMILTGARRNEVLSATWDQFDLLRGVWTKPSHHTKQKRTEHIPLSSGAVQLISTMRAGANPDCPFLLPSDLPGQPLSNIKRFWRSAQKAAGINGVRLHDLRHTFASFLVSQGVSLHIAGKLLGHTQPQATARYAHVDDTALRRATEGFSSSIAQLGGALPALASPVARSG